MVKKITLLGASGSIGIQTIDIIRDHPSQFELVAVSVGQRVETLRSILDEFTCVKLACVQNPEQIAELAQTYPQLRFVSGDEGLLELAKFEQADLVVNALVGFVGLKPTLAAIETGHDVALANKESLVVAGEFVMKAVQKHHVHLFPIDSEHSALLQCLQGNKMEQVKRFIITASGGSFKTKTREELKDVTVEEALRHPNWAMGAKITIDSATMMNKGFEVMEAHWLYGLDYDKISVVLHDESIIHSMVEYEDHSIMAQMATADMRLPIQYALSYPERLEMLQNNRLDFSRMMTLHFKPMDFGRFPMLHLAYRVGKIKGNAPAVLNAANEEANLAFRQGKCSFLQIEELVFKAIESMTYKKEATLDDIFEADKWARDFVKGNL